VETLNLTILSDGGMDMVNSARTSDCPSSSVVIKSPAEESYHSMGTREHQEETETKSHPKADRKQPVLNNFSSYKRVEKTVWYQFNWPWENINE